VQETGEAVFAFSIIPPFTISWDDDGLHYHNSPLPGYDQGGQALTPQGRVLWIVYKLGKLGVRVGKWLAGDGSVMVDQLIEEFIVFGSDLIDIPLEEIREALGFQRPGKSQDEPAPEPGGQIVLGYVDP